MALLSKVGCMICLTLVFTNIVVFTTTNTASAQCQGDFQGLIQQCSRYVQRQGPVQNPSQQCCNIVRNVDLPCVCQHVTTEVERIISMKKAASIAAFCGKPLAHGTQCGSYKVPRS